MTLKAWHAGLFGLAAFTLASLFLVSSPDLSAAPTLQSPQVQASFSQSSYDPGDTAVFHVTDSRLNTLLSCTATWVDADPGGEPWLVGETYWNIFSGEPATSSYQGFDSGCAYVSTSATPLEEMPNLGNESWIATVNGLESDIAEFYADDDFLGDTALSTDVKSTSTVSIPFYFHAPNTYAVSEQRVRVTSAADTVGEWVALSEVVSTADSTAASRSGVFRGSVELRADAATVEGDGVVSVDGAGDAVRLTYYGPSGQTEVRTASANVGALPPTRTPTPTPTPTPLPEIAFSQPSFQADQSAVFYVADRGLDIPLSCTATWVDADPAGVIWEPSETYWNIFSGEPAPSAYQGFNSSCAFASTSTTPLEAKPDLRGETWEAFVDRDFALVETFNAEGEFTGSATLSVKVTSTSTIVFPFYFHAQNRYLPSDQLAQVTSVADPVGEWVELVEVASATDSAAAIRSGVFRGSVELRTDVDAVQGDGAVRVEGAGDVVQLTYYGPSGQTAVSTASAEVGAHPPSPTPTPTPTPTPLPDIAFSQPSFMPDERAVLYVTDWELNTLSSCTATWIDAVPDGETWDAFTHWNVFSGEPAPSAYRGWGSGCGLESTSFSSVETIPVPWLGRLWLATVNGVDAIVGEFYVDGEFAGNAAMHANNFSSINTIELPFYFHVHDTYPASAQRARVTSVADRAGEWVALTEVESTTDSTPGVDSGVFRGSVELRVDASAVEGDGVVSVGAGGDELRLRYYGPSGDRVVGSSRAVVLATEPTNTPTPTPTPARRWRWRPTPKPTPTITPTPTPVPAVRRIATLTPTPAPTHTATPTATRTATPRATPTPTYAPTFTPSPTAFPRATPTPWPTPSPTVTPTPSPTATPTPTFTPTVIPTATPTATAIVVEVRPPATIQNPATTVPSPTEVVAQPGGGCGGPAAGASAQTAMANLALLAAPVGLAGVLRRRRRD